MKSIEIKILGILLLFLSLFVQAQDKICNPDQSIENQKAKVITQDAKALLVKIMQDKAMLAWPVRVCDCWLSSLYGPRKSGYHNGIDLAGAKGTPVYAAADGYVQLAQKSLDKQGYGNMIVLDHKDIGYKTRYAHLHTFKVRQDEQVKRGQHIANIGATGHVVAKNMNTDPSHLHFEVYRGETRINPLIALFATDHDWVQAYM